MSNASPWATIVLAILSSGSIWGFLQFVLSRRTRKQQHLKDAEALNQARRVARDAEEQRVELLAEAQATAQRTALESAAERFDSLDKDYRECREGLREVRGVAFLLVDAMNVIMSRVQATKGADEYTAVLTADDVGKARFAIEQARQRLYS
jgi:hypothetical protein